MRKTLKFLIASGACLVMAGTGQMSAQAAMNLETDAPVAGASVAINNYYASSLNPEKELAEAFASKEVLAVAGAGQTGVAGGAQTAKPAQVAAETKAQPKETTGETEAVVRAMHDAGIGYGSINHPVDRDPVCGYNGIIGDSCPKCGRQEEEVHFERIRRITGYLTGSLESWNSAKQAEERDRVKHR